MPDATRFQVRDCCGSYRCSIDSVRFTDEAFTYLPIKRWRTSYEFERLHDITLLTRGCSGSDNPSTAKKCNPISTGPLKFNPLRNRILPTQRTKEWPTWLD